MSWLDTIAEKVQPIVQVVINGGVTLRDALDSTWLGASLHPALTDVSIGFWTAALIFDGLEYRDGLSQVMRKAADAAIAVGVAGVGIAGVASL